MTPQQYQRVKDLFQQATELPLADRLDFVEAAVADDFTVRQEILSLLVHHDPQMAAAEGNSFNKRQRLPSARSSSTGSAVEKQVQPLSIKPKVDTRGLKAPRSPWYWIVPLLMLSTFGVGSWMFRTIQNRLRESQAQQLGALRYAAVALLESWGQAQRTKLISFATSPDVLQATSADDFMPLEKFKTLIANRFSPESRVELCDPTGKVLLSSVAERKELRIDPALLPWFAEAIQTKDAVTRIRPAEPETLPLLIGLIGVYDVVDQLWGVLVVQQTSEQQPMDALLSPMRFGKTGEVYAVSSTGVAVSTPRELGPLIREGWYSATDPTGKNSLKLVDPGVDLSQQSAARSRETLPMTRAAAGVESRQKAINVDGYRNYCGQQVLGAWEWIPRLQIGVVVELAADEAYLPLSAVQTGLGVVLGSLVLAGLSALGWVWLRRGQQPEAKSILGAYELIEPLGSGGMGTVYRARHSLLKRPSAIKVVRSDRLSEEDIARFDREVRVASKLHSPHTVSIFDYGKDKRGQWYFAMELLDGMTLDKVVARYGPLSAPRVLYIWEQICQSLQEAHQMGLVHRDIKPQNIMLSCRGGSPDFAVVFDFGLAKPIATDTSLFATNERLWVGTPIYMSPERIRDPRQSDLRSDLYATGVLAYFLLVGNEPFVSSDPAALFEQIVSVKPPPPSRDAPKPVPPDVDAIVLKCLEKNVEHRAQTADELRESLSQLLLKYPWSRTEALLWWQSAIKT